MFADIAITFGPVIAYYLFWIRLLTHSPRTILGSDWASRLHAWSPGAFPVVLTTLLLGPGIIYPAIGAYLLARKQARETQILPRRPRGE